MSLSLIINIAVLIPICLGLMLDSAWIASAYGSAAPARSILLSVYLAILAISVWQLRRPQPETVAALLLVQVIYKLTTPFTVGTLANPVIISNLMIAAVHCAALLQIRKGQAKTV